MALLVGGVATAAIETRDGTNCNLGKGDDMHDDQGLVWWSWADIVQRANRLGIPNFQRGAVWGMTNRTALLESMYEQSPCGSFVLWQPDDDGESRRHGVPVRLFGQDVTPMWLVDGQQRTRAMLDTYQQLLAVPTISGWSLVRTDEIDSLRAVEDEVLSAVLPVAAQDERQSENDTGSKFWGVVLPAMRQFDEDGASYFAGKSESSGVRRGSVFRRHGPSTRVLLGSKGKAKTAPPQVVGLIPLATLVAPASIFHNGNLRRHVKKALETFGGDSPDFEQLNQSVPWGPQFITGHAYERIEDGAPVPMTWEDVHPRMGEADVAFMVDRLSGLFAQEWRPVFRQFREMLTEGRFAVGWLPRSDVSAAIDAYVRINRAGIRVRQEEQALALLSRAHPHLLDELAEFIRLRDGELSAEDGRSLLVHESDRQMGFAVWMRAVTRYSALALLGTTASGWLGTSAIDKDTFGYRLGRVSERETEAGKRTWARDYLSPDELVADCSVHATQALTLVDSLLSDELSFDHRMARPSTWALTPIVDLLYRVPQLALASLECDSDFRAAVARLLHWTLLAPYLDQADLRRLISDIHGIENPYAEQPVAPWAQDDKEWPRQLRDAMGRYQDTLLDLWRRRDSISAERRGGNPVPTGGLTRSQAIVELAVRAFEAEVREARSLQHPAIGWLYAIERRGGAREFLWQAQHEAHEEHDKLGIPASHGESRTEEALRRLDVAGLYPEKQHIVPFDYARRIVGKGGTRATASPANAIGNLTWLSQRQNGLDGLSNRWTVMDAERDAENLAARGMLWQSSRDDAPTALNLYEKIRDAVLDGRGADAERPFDAFCETRTDWMVQQMREWLEQPLADSANWWLEG